MRAERVRKRKKEKKEIYTPFHTMAQKMNQWTWQLVLVTLLPPPHRVFPSPRPTEHREQMGSNPTQGLLLKWFPPCPADEELTSSGTMAEWEKGRGCHRPSDRHTMVFDRGVVTLRCGEPKVRSRVRWQGRARVIRESLWEVQAWPSCTRVGNLFLSPFVQWTYKYFPVVFPCFVNVM